MASSEIAERTAAASGNLSVRGLALARGHSSLFEQMSWNLPRGKFLAVTGPSGVGKSSLLACIRGTLSPSAGSTSLGTDDPTKIGIVFQHLRLSNNLTVLTNVLCGRLGRYSNFRSIFGFPAAERETAFETIGRLGIGGLCHKPVRNISGGEQQRTAVARVLFQEPDLILADEPTSDLDTALARDVLTEFRQLCRTRNATVICVMHDDRMVAEFADLELRLDADRPNGWEMHEVIRR